MDIHIDIHVYSSIGCVDSAAVVLAKPASARLHCISEVSSRLARALSHPDTVVARTRTDPA